MSLMTFQVFKQPLSTIATITSDDFKGHWTLTPVGPPYVSNVTDSFTYKATNFAGASDLVTQQFQFVDNFNSKPVCTSLNQTPRAFVHQGKPLTLKFQCTDAQADPITGFTKTSGTNGGTLDNPVQSAEPVDLDRGVPPAGGQLRGPRHRHRHAGRRLRGRHSDHRSASTSRSSPTPTRAPRTATRAR